MKPNLERFGTLGLLLLGLVGVQARSANLIVNGSFEVPTVPVGSFHDFGSGSTLITGWTVVGPQASVVSNTFSQECCTFPAEDGVQWLDLTGDNANSAEGVEQTIATTAGTQYMLSFFVGNIHDPNGIFGTTSSVKVFLGGPSGTLLDTVTNSSTTPGTQVWQEFFEQFTATGSSTTIAFINNDPRGDNSNGLDNVSLEAGRTVGVVPEPATLTLIGIGLFGLSLGRKIRRRRVS
jgi:hapalindole biogenesis HpiC1 cyclase-like protein/PEP-CTERM motif-containing protein